jgi:phosphoglycerate dehydrogenase-like enzyme
MRTLVTVWGEELRSVLFSPECRRQLEAVSEVEWVTEGKPYEHDDLMRDIGRYDACITSWGSPKITKEVLQRADNLKFIGHAAGTLIPFVDPEVFDTNIIVVNANRALARSTAELAVSLMMAGAWNLMGYSKSLATGAWRANNDTVMGLFGQQVGLIGFGEVAKEVVRLLKPYETRIRLSAPYCTAEEAAELGVELCSLDELLAASDIVSLHDTLTPSTRGMIGREQLGRLKDGALLVNTARAPIIDEQALIDELSTGRIYAALDVFYTEPPVQDYPLLHLPNVLCVPHIGAFSRYWKPQLGHMVAEDLHRFAAGQTPLRQITGERFIRMTQR